MLVSSLGHWTLESGTDDSCIHHDQSLDRLWTVYGGSTDE